MVSFVKDIITDLDDRENKFSASLRVAGSLLTAAGVIETVFLITNPQFGLPVTILQLAVAILDTAFSYDLVKMGLNKRNVAVEDMTQERLYQGTLLKKFYSSFQDDKMKDDREIGRAGGIALRILGTLCMANGVPYILAVPLLPVARELKLIRLFTISIALWLSNEMRLVGQNVKKFYDREIEKKDLAQGTLFIQGAMKLHEWAKTQ